MTRVVQINTGVMVKQAQNNSNPVILPNYSVMLAQLAAGTRQALQNVNLTVGSGGDVANGAADFTSIQSAINALPSGGIIAVRNGTYTESIIPTSNHTIIGQGHLTVINGTVTFSGNYNCLSNLKHNSVTFTGNKNLINGTWLNVTGGATITDNGSGNDARYIEE